MNFEEEFKSWTLDQKVEWALGPNICNLSENMRSIIVDLKAENEQLKEKKMSGADPQAIRNRVLKKVNAQKNNWYKVKSWQPKQSKNKKRKTK